MQEFITPIVKATKVSILYILLIRCCLFVDKSLREISECLTVLDFGEQCSIQFKTKNAPQEVTENGEKKKISREFYSMIAYEDWLEETDKGKGWELKYYKGLGTSTSKEAKAYFADLPKHQVEFEYEDQEGIPQADGTSGAASSSDRMEIDGGAGSNQVNIY